MRLRAPLAATALVLGLGACAQPGYDARRLQSQLVDAGATLEEAQCVTRGLENTFDLGQLASQSEPTSKELETTRRLLEDCRVIDAPRPSTPSS